MKVSHDFMLNFFVFRKWIEEFEANGYIVKYNKSGSTDGYFVIRKYSYISFFAYNTYEAEELRQSVETLLSSRIPHCLNHSDFKYNLTIYTDDDKKTPIYRIVTSSYKEIIIYIRGLITAKEYFKLKETAFVP